MKTRTPLIRAALATAFVGGLFAILHGAPAVPASESMTVEAGAPLDATLLPIVSVYAYATNPDGIVAMRIAATEALPVTLLPTVHVRLSLSELAAAAPVARHLLAQVRHEPAAIVDDGYDRSLAPSTGESEVATGETGRLRMRTMPR